MIFIFVKFKSFNRTFQRSKVLKRTAQMVLKPVMPLIQLSICCCNDSLNQGTKINTTRSTLSRHLQINTLCVALFGRVSSLRVQTLSQR